MLVCKKCRCRVSERIAQQSFSEMESVLLEHHSAIAARRKAMNEGPVCDPCLAHWQEKMKDESPTQVCVPDLRSPAMKTLDKACLALKEIDPSASA